MGILFADTLFAMGVVVGALLLVAGLAFGLWIGRRTSLIHQAKTLGDYHLISMLGGFSKLTNGFAADVSQYREIVDEVTERMHSAQADASGGPSDSVMAMMEKISDANDQLQERIDKAETTLKEQAEEIAGYMCEARTDKLTGLANRRVLDDELPRRVAESNRYETPIGLVIADVDFFKKFNDEYGHLAGDLVLQQVAQVMQETVRESDLAVRMGGEEFAVILPGVRAKQVWLATERIRAAIEKHKFSYEGTELSVTVSCGATDAFPNDTPTAMIKRADEALYAAKRAGRNRSHRYDEHGISPIAPTAVAQNRAANLQKDNDFGKVCVELRDRLMAVVQGEDESVQA